MDDKKYWAEYYATHSNPTDASSFAQFILPELGENKNLIELGCGNGRDSIYFARNNVNVTAVDQVEKEIEYLNENYKTDSITFIADDFTNLENTQSEIIKNTDFDYIYSRFTMHSIDEEQEDRTLDWIASKLTEGGRFLLEARSLNDPMFTKGEHLSETENFTTHYRRYMDLDRMIEKLESRNFEITYKIEDNDLAVYKEDNPYVIRIIAEKL